MSGVRSESSFLSPFYFHYEETQELICKVCGEFFSLSSSEALSLRLRANIDPFENTAPAIRLDYLIGNSHAWVFYKGRGALRDLLGVSQNLLISLIGGWP